ncbi:purine-binding chemotaxis protein CheW [Luteimonas sp. SJ-92]|uniref:Chemotaxis protein CheW n=1 Tax=Luteimonas salinisoli TaxID=2752307 RepID=A0A853JBI8_9GAMM|nr:purine-binding chemotaxis protein CheW [Luteimonas salinisoli]
MNAPHAVDAYLDLLLTAPVPEAVPAAAPQPVPAVDRPALVPAVPGPRPAVARPAAAPAAWEPVAVPEAPQYDPCTSESERRRRAGDRTSRWLRLRCGAQIYALELLKIREVVLPAPLLPMRGATAAMAGVMNLRGQVVPVIDLGLHLDQDAVDDGPGVRIVVLEEGGEVLGLRVSAVEDVTRLGEQQIEPPDHVRVGRSGDDRFRGIARQGGRLLILLDASRLLGVQG